MEERKALGVGTIMEDIFKMAEGNPGAVTAIAAIMKAQGEMGYLTLLALDDMNIRGAQIWVGYKDVCGHDTAKFIALIEARDQSLIEKINEAFGGGTGWQAVVSGASYMAARPRLERAGA